MSKRASRPRALAASLPAVARAALRKRGLADGGIVTDWPAIVGEVLARHSLPQRLAFPRGERTDGTLHILVSGPLALELQHLEPLVVERINGHFGYNAVARLRILQGTLPAPPVPRPRVRRPAAVPAPPAALAAVEDDDLRAALERLGRALAARDADAGEEG